MNDIHANIDASTSVEAYRRLEGCPSLKVMLSISRRRHWLLLTRSCPGRRRRLCRKHTSGCGHCVVEVNIGSGAQSALLERDWRCSGFAGSSGPFIGLLWRNVRRWEEPIRWVALNSMAYKHSSSSVAELVPPRRLQWIPTHF